MDRLERRRGRTVISNLPERFTLKIVNEISPARILRWKGFISQAMRFAPSVSRRFPPYYVLSRPPGRAGAFTTKIIADKTKYPFLLSNGNRLRKVNWKMDVIGYSGRIHSQTVLPVCAGGW